MKNDTSMQSVVKRRPGFQRWRVIAGTCATLFISSSLFAGVNVFPTQLFVVSPNRSAPLTITNPSDSTVEAWVSFDYGYPVAFDTGKVVMYRADTTASEEFSARGWLKAIPQRFTLRPQESQVIRIFGVPPPGLPNGEYWSRVVVSSKPRNARVFRETEKVSITMEVISQTSVPFHYRNGPVSSGVVLTDAGASIGDGYLGLRLNMERVGNGSFWGRINYKLLNSTGRVVRTKDFNLVVYKQMIYSVRDTLSSAEAGPYTVEFLIDNKHPALNTQVRLPSEPLLKRIPVLTP